MSATPTGPCHLLELPAELRNSIYRYVLLGYWKNWMEDQTRPIVDIEDHDFEQPSLLRTCRQIRSEASPIYYLQTHFYLTIHNFDPEIVHRLHRQMVRYWSNSDNQLQNKFKHRCLVTSGPGFGWNNLMAWLKLYYDGEVSYPKLCDCGWDDEICCAAQHAFVMVKKLASSPWEVVKTLQESTSQPSPPTSSPSPAQLHFNSHEFQR